MSRNRLLVSLVVAFICIGSADAQYRPKKKELFRYDNQLRPHGWHFAPGFTYTFKDYFQKTPTYKYGPDTTLTVNIDPKGKLALYAEFGYFHLLRYGLVFQYLDYSVAFKQLKGKESYQADFSNVRTRQTYSSSIGNGVFRETFVTVNFNLNNILQVSDYNFFTNSLGFNVDYRFINNTEMIPTVSVVPRTVQPGLRGQLHYKLGYGHKIYDHLFMIVMLETPLVNVYPWENWRSTVTWFNSRYKPVILTLRFMALRWPKREDCPPVYNSPFDPAK